MGVPSSRYKDVGVMAAKSTGPAGRQTARAKATRAQRRAAERTQVQQRQKKKQRQMPSIGLIGGLITILAVAIILLHAVLSSGTTNNNVKGLTNPGALAAGTTPLKAGTVAPDFRLK